MVVVPALTSAMVSTSPVQLTNREGLSSTATVRSDGQLTLSHEVAGAGDDQDILSYEIGGYGVVVTHSDGRVSSIHIGNGTHITAPLHKLIALISLRHELNHVLIAISNGPFSGGSYRPPVCAGDSQVIPINKRRRISLHRLPTQKRIGHSIDDIPDMGRVARAEIGDCHYLPACP